MNSEISSPRRRAGRPAKRSKSRLSAAAEYGDMDLDEEPLPTKPKQLPPQVLEKVVVPVKGRLSFASSLSSVYDQSSEYDTPDTSMIVTPAESVVNEERSLSRLSRTSRTITSYQLKEPFTGKRKRLAVEELMEYDAVLAEELQKQEYSRDQEVASRTRRARDALLGDPEEDLLFDLSRERSPGPDDCPKLDISTSGRSNRRRPKALPSQSTPVDLEVGWSLDELLDEDDISETQLPRNKRAKTDNRTTLPSRAARASANTSITDRTFRGVLNSEDSDLSDHSDDGSLFGSDIVSYASEDSEDADGEAGDVVGAVNSLTTAKAARTLTSTSSVIPGTGRRGAPSTQATNPTRGRRSWQRRIEDRVSSETPLSLHPGLRHTLGCKRAAEARESAS